MSVKPIFFALDGKELSEFTETLEKLKGVIYGVKVGLEMFTAEGPSSVEKLKNDGWKVFLDLKLHDIPNTVQAATVSAGNIGADYLTIHKESGIDGVICPASEISSTEELFDLIVTPGIRLESDSKDDQRNTTTPEKAIELGAKYIVMGISIKNNLDYVINNLTI